MDASIQTTTARGPRESAGNWWGGGPPPPPDDAAAIGQVEPDEQLLAIQNELMEHGAGSQFIPTEHPLLKAERLKLEQSLHDLDYADIQDARNRCKLCAYNLDVRSASVEKKDILHGFFIIYVEHLHHESNNVFRLMEEYWQNTMVRVFSDVGVLERIPIHAAEIQVHYQRCISTGGVEILKEQKYVVRVMIDTLLREAVWVQEYIAGLPFGQPKLSVDAVKVYGLLTSTLNKLQAELNTKINAIRQTCKLPILEGSGTI